MMEQANDKRPHLVLTETSQVKSFTAHSSGGETKTTVPDLPRAQHGTSLQAQLAALVPLAEQAKALQQDLALKSGLGLQIQFVGQPDVELAFASLGNEAKGIELLSVRQEGEHTIANVFVPDGQLAHFERYVTDYLQEKKNKNGGALDHKALLNTIFAIRAEALRALWMDDPELLPADQSEAFWWEVWLPVRGKHAEIREEVINDFRKLALSSGCQISESRVDFPERTVVLMYGSEQQFSQSVMTLNCVTELRRAKETAEFFDSMGVEEQQAWQNELLGRATFSGDTNNAPRICLLDTGVNRAHPLVAPVIQSNDLHTVNPAWGVDDQANHGTGLAGIATYGDLADALDSDLPIRIDHLLESVKLTDKHGGNSGSNEFHANLFADAVSQPEVAAPNRPRVFSSAVTSADYRDRGRPSSWSAMVDRLAADAENNGAFPRLFVQSAGNMRDQHAWKDYPASISTNLIHDPGQAWNSLTVGAYTTKVDITEPDSQGYIPIAPSGGLSPMTSSSSTWDKAWPLKPDVVFEGGNAAQDKISAVFMPSLGLLTTHNNPQQRLFTTTNATSAASALCARMAAQLMAAYPQLRPETIRALIVHSAAWTEAMRRMYLRPQGRPTQKNFVDLIRHCGWGVPNIERALWSAANSLTLIVEDSVHPYKKDGSIKSRDMNLHALPWPKDELEALGAMLVEMHVTLSYFIEPNPSARGAVSKYHYASHRLRFDVRRPLETTDDFIARINAAVAQEENGEQANPKDPAWVLGDKQRHKGSLHQDIWKGAAADLANRGYLAVYPAAGWWRTRPKLERYNLPAHYSLIISIRTPETETDLYNAVVQKIAVPVASIV